MFRPVLAASAALALCAVLPAQAAGTAAQRTWHGDQATVPAAQSPGKSGSGVTVAVLDSWVDGGHPDFQSRVLSGADCTSGSCRAGQGSDQCDHGTHVAGTVASSSYGVAPKARILPVRVLTFDAASGDCTGQPSDVAAGIRYAVAQGAQVLNLSLGPDVPGLSASSAIPAAVREAADAGVVVIFSAGNTGAPVTDSYGDAAVIVAATGPSGALASYSQRGVGVDLAGPGGDPSDPDACRQSDCVTSLYPGGRYAVAAGTSMAAPHVSGVAALLIAQQPSRTRQQVIARLTSTARPLAQAGAGRVDAARALGATASSASPKPRPSSTTPVVRSSSRPAAPAPAGSTSSAGTPTKAGAPATKPAKPPVAVALPTSPAAASSAPAPTESIAPGPSAAARPLPTEDVPVPLGLLAGLLVAGAGAGVVVEARRARAVPTAVPA